MTGQVADMIAPDLIERAHRVGKRAFARPLSLNFDVAPETLVPVVGMDAHDPALRAILAQARLEAESDPQGGWVHYSRRKNWYAENRRYLHAEQTYANVTRAIAIAERNGLIEHLKAAQGQLGTESRFRATRRLLTLPLTTLELQKPAEVIILKDRGTPKTKSEPRKPPRPIPYVDTDETRRMRLNVTQINEAIGSVKLEHPVLGIICPGRPTRIGNSNPGPAILRLERIFTDSFDLHGRFYGFWQNWPSRERESLLIDGSPVVEHDYRQMHPTLLYARRGIELPRDFDAYDIAGVPREMRPLIKIIFNTMVNARSVQGLHRSIRHKALQLTKEGVIPPGFDPSSISKIMAAIRHCHTIIANAFYSDAGLTLMRIDSDIAEAVMLRLLGRSIVPLPVHDSFIVQAVHSGVLREIMDDVLQAKLAQLGTQNVVAPNFRPKTEKEQSNLLKTIANLSSVS